MLLRHTCVCCMAIFTCCPPQVTCQFLRGTIPEVSKVGGDMSPLSPRWLRPCRAVKMLGLNAFIAKTVWRCKMHRGELKILQVAQVLNSSNSPPPPSTGTLTGYDIHLWCWNLEYATAVQVGIILWLGLFRPIRKKLGAAIPGEPKNSSSTAV